MHGGGSPHNDRGGRICDLDSIRAEVKVASAMSLSDSAGSQCSSVIVWWVFRLHRSKYGVLSENVKMILG